MTRNGLSWSNGAQFWLTGLDLHPTVWQYAYCTKPVQRKLTRAVLRVSGKYLTTKSTSTRLRSVLVAMIFAALLVGGMTAGYLLGTTGQRIGTTMTLVTTETIPSSFTVAGNIPHVVLNSQNHTFTMTYHFTAYKYPLTLSYDQNQSYAVQYSNDTQWLSTSRPCESSTTMLTGTASTYTATAVTTTAGQVPCGATNGEWYPVNTVITPYLVIGPSEVQMTIGPSNVAANSTQEVMVSVVVAIHPGVYALNLAVDVRTPGYQPVTYLLGYAPLIVRSQ